MNEDADIVSRVLVCGSRATGNPKAAMDAIALRLAKLPDGTVIVHGAAKKGVDGWADAIAYSFGFKTDPHPADWKKYGKGAGFIRNIEMLDTKPDLVIAFWNGSSTGTLHTINEAKVRGIRTEVIPIEPT